MTVGPGDSDEALMQRVAEGSAAAYGVLVRRHAERYLALASRLSVDHGMAEEAVQDAFAKLWQQPHRFDARKARFTTWFYRVVANRCFDLRRKRRPEPLPEGFDQADDGPTAEDRLVERDRARLLGAALDALPERQRLAVTLCYLEGLSNAEAAAVLDVHVKALESLLTRARGGLRKRLGADRAVLLAPLAKDA
ncbi:sigma-70 family RNA polymerase sigma factor [Rhodothalassium salexigens]|nr:sigma-70 family RNA polymerase sigma factor [Rhodothalassium salexigens]MBB4211247.1 RNA polymerase sigma-70 factor (ECF subfamily) [Rhodothalassium salexigens DSM 2132]MBK1639341.1 hypothetical protein [Rhodothalassium salexigens DSM 2132]